MSWCFRGKLTGDLLMLFTLGTFGASSFAAELTNSEYRGWPTRKIENGLLTVHVAPQLGGRVLQVKLGNHEYFWTNKKEQGKGPTKTGLNSKKGWINYGGSKLWPSPQGWSGPEEWPGPPDAVLDGSAHSVTMETIASDSKSTASISLASPQDARSGIQFAKTVSVGSGAAAVTLDLKMTNIDSKPRKWGIWQVTQFDATGKNGAKYNDKLRVYCKANPESRFKPRGYQELFGLANNPSFERVPGTDMVVSTFQYLVGKIGMDCSAGWQAIVDENAGYALVEKFTYVPGAEYPFGDSTEVWMNGAGQIVSAGEIATLKDDLDETFPYVESEIMAPLTKLEPGESTDFHVTWLATCLGKGNKVVDCTEAALISEPLIVKQVDGKDVLSGKMGVFYEGTLELRSGDTAGVENTLGKMNVSPLKPVDLQKGDLAKIDIPAGSKVKLVLTTAAGQSLPIELAGQKKISF